MAGDHVKHDDNGPDLPRFGKMFILNSLALSLSHRQLNDLRNIEEEEHMSLNAKINRSLTISRKPRKQRANRNRKVEVYSAGATTNGIVKKELAGKEQPTTLAHQVITTANKGELSMILEQSETNASNGTSGKESLLRIMCEFN